MLLLYHPTFLLFFYLEILSHCASITDRGQSWMQDELYIQQLVEQCHDTVRRLLGPLKALQWSRETQLAAEVMYYVLTTGKGLQTLGEEYCEILQTVGTGAGLAPGKFRRGALVLFQAVIPYVSEKFIARQDIGGVNLFSNPEIGQSERESNVPSNPRETTPGQDPHRINEMRLKALATETLQRYRRVLQNTVDIIRTWKETLRLRMPWSQVHLNRARKFATEYGGTLLRLHLALFYVFGLYYQLSKRFTGVRFISVSATSPHDRASFRALGYILLAQLVIAGGVHAIRQHHHLSYLPQRFGKALGLFAEASDGNEVARKGPAGYVRLLRPDGTEITPAEERAAMEMDADLVAGDRTTGGEFIQHKKCPLCLGRLIVPTATTCGHLFCWNCVAEWVCSQKAECPLCRASIWPSELVVVRHGGY